MLIYNVGAKEGRGAWSICVGYLNIKLTSMHILCLILIIIIPFLSKLQNISVIT